MDDFQTPSGGLVEVTPSLFADSWKLQQHCPLPPPIQVKFSYTMGLNFIV